MRKNTTKIILILLIFLISCGCAKKSLSPNAFSAYFKNLNYKIYDLSEHYKSYNIETVLIAKKHNYQIEYFVYRDKNEATKRLKENANALISMNLQAEKKENNNSIKYSFLTSTYNIIISQIDNTIVYTEVPIEFQNEVNKNLSYLNY